MYNPTERLMRSRTEKVIAGVAGGIATYFAIDPVFVRLGMIALIFTGVGMFLYPILWVIMPIAPEQPGTPHTPRYDPLTGVPVSDATEIPINDLGSNPAPSSSIDRNRQIGILVIGIGALAVASFLLGPAFGRLLFPILLIGAGVLILRRNQG
jgi:phage shock protein C